MSAGTLKLTNGSTAITGTGTNFTTDLTTADFVVVTVGGTTHSLAVDSVTNATALVLSAPFTGPTTAVVAWQAVPRKTMLRVTAELNKQVTEALLVANEDAINWQAVLSSPDTVNVMLPDGTTLTGFSWRKINDLLTALDPDDLSATAAQINTDAQQVATDKPIIIQAKTDAEAAAASSAASATNAANSASAANTAKTGSEAARDAALDAQTAAELAEANAKISETNAAESKRLAEAAIDVANSSAGIYQDTTSGLAGTATGDYFSVPSPLDDEVLILYRNDAGIATEVKRYPSAALVESTREAMTAMAASLVLTQSIIAAHHAFV